MNTNTVYPPFSPALVSNLRKGCQSLECLFPHSDHLKKVPSSEASEVFESAHGSSTSNDCSQIVNADETLSSEQSQHSETTAETLQSIDESAPVINDEEMQLFEPLLAGGDATENINDAQEKRPCNLEYQLSVEPKLNVLMKQARKIAESRETSGAQESHQHQRSPRTLARRPTVKTDIKLQRNILFNPKKLAELSRRQNENASGTVAEGNIRMKEEIDVPSSNDESSCEMAIVMIKQSDSPESRKIAGSAVAKARTRWITTKNHLSKKAGNNATLEKSDGQSRDTNGSSQENTGKTSGDVDHRLSDSVDDVRESTSKSKLPSKKNRNASGGMRKAHEKETSGEQRKRHSGNAKERTLQERRETSKITSRVLERMRETVSDDEMRIHSDSSDTLIDSDESTDHESEPPAESRKRDRSRIIETITSDSDSSVEIPRRRQRTNRNEAGPSRVSSKRSSNAQEQNLSRGQVWRMGLINKNQTDNRRAPFTPAERKKMLQYLIKNDCINMAKGLVIWKNMIQDGYLTHRTPQSLQNQFRKQILPNIRSVNYLSQPDIQRFLNLKTKRR